MSGEPRIIAGFGVIVKNADFDRFYKKGPDLPPAAPSAPVSWQSRFDDDPTITSLAKMHQRAATRRRLSVADMLDDDDGLLPIFQEHDVAVQSFGGPDSPHAFLVIVETLVIADPYGRDGGEAFVYIAWQKEDFERTWQERLAAVCRAVLQTDDKTSGWFACLSWEGT